MNKRSMTPYKRVMTALRGGCPDTTPFTVYDNMLPQCFIEKELRNRGICLVKRITSYKIIQPNVTIRSYNYFNEKGREETRIIYSTPVGEVSKLIELDTHSEWTKEHMFKSPEDYKVLMYLIKDCVVEPNYEFAINTVKSLGEDFVVRDQIPSEPLQEIMATYMGTNNFCIEWMDNRDEVLKLYEALMDVSRKVYPIVANGPLEFANLGGNVVPQIIGVDTFKKYYVPNYNEAAEVLHKKGKLIGCHFDADNALIMNEIGETHLDYIEAYDPGISPSVKAARKFWPDKVLWLNWPSSWHLRSLNDVYKNTVKMIDEAEQGNGFIIGITEDVPEGLWQSNFLTIMNAIEDHSARKNSRIKWR